MRTTRTAIFIAAIISLTGMCPAALATEYFVSKAGSDEHDGTSLATAFRTVQRGVDALQPGDTLTIAPGEYHEGVYRDKLGNADATTTIRAEIPRTVLLRGDVPAPVFTKVAGYRFVYVADFTGEAHGVIEAGTPMILSPSTTVADLEFSPGTWFHDVERGRLYISSSDLRPPERNQYRVAVLPQYGLHLSSPERVVVEGIGATGFQTKMQQPDYPGYYSVWGIMLSGARHCVIRDCVAFLNHGGIAIHSARNEGGHNLIDGCVAFANGNTHTVEGGNICVYSSNHDTVQNCYFYLADGNGNRHYGAGIRGPAVTRNSIGWGNRSTDYFLKGGPIAEFGLVENSISLGLMHSHNVRHSIIGTRNQYNAEPSIDNIRLASDAGDAAAKNREFADPENLDFRLQATSSFRAKDGNPDRGPYPYQPNIFYVKSDGNDDANGLSMRNAWRTFARATRDLRPGDTVYLEPGTYEAGSPVTVVATGGESRPVSIRGRGIEPVVITGVVEIAKSAGITFERLNFAGPVSVGNSGKMAFRNCRFFSEGTSLTVNGVAGLRVTHCEFTGFSVAAMLVAGTLDAFISGNIFDNATGPALRTEAGMVRYADYNAYRDSANAWRFFNSAEPTSLDKLGGVHERYAKILTPEYRMERGVPVLANAHAFRSGGPNGGALGLHLEYRPRKLDVVGPVVHSMTSTTANIEWWTSRPASCTIAWGTTPACENSATLLTHEFGNFSLTGLEPGKTYYFAIRAVEPRLEGDQQQMGRMEPGAEPLKFTTPTAPRTPVTHYVAPDGDNGNTGLSRAQAWRTVAQAGERAIAGDTIMVAGGTYVETVHVRASGEKDLPITFKAMPGEKVTFDGNNRLMSMAFSVARKKHIHIDGFYFTNFGLKGWETIVSLFDSSHIHITRCFMNNRGKGYPSHFLYTLGGEDVLLSNSVIANGMYGLYTTGTTNLRIENNLFLRNFITACTIRGPGEKGAHLRGNIFIDNLPGKARVQLFELGGGIEPFHFRDNCFFLRLPDDERKSLFFYGNGPGRVSVPEYERLTGNSGNVIRDPAVRMTVGVGTPKDSRGNDITFIPDWMFNKPMDFPDLFTTDSELIQRGIGLRPEAFKDFHFNANRSAEPE